MADETPERAWYEIVRDVLKRHNVNLITYVPDNVLRPLIEALEADPFFTCFSTSREEEAIGIVSGAWMAGRRGIVLMQTSGFATLPNVLASLNVPFQIPALMMVSERGTLGEFNIGQTMVARTMRPVLDALAMEHYTMTRLDEVEFIVDRSLVQAFATLASVCFILSPLLTGGKVFAQLCGFVRLGKGLVDLEQRRALGVFGLAGCARIGLDAANQLLELFARCKQGDGVVVALAHLAAVQAGQQLHLGIDLRLGQHEEFLALAEEVVEALGDVARHLDVLNLVASHGHLVGVEHQNISSHQYRIRE